MLPKLRQTAEVCVDRLRHLSDHPRLGHIGVGYNGNLGDEAALDAARILLGRATLLTYHAASRESRLTWLRLAGRSYFNAVVLGGGTLINDMFLGVVRGALEQGLPIWTLGTGVGKPGFFCGAENDLEPWRELLPRMRRVGVRGPRSAMALAGIGFEHAEVVGDVALALARDDRVVRPEVDPPRFAVNFTYPRLERHGPWVEATVNSIARGVRSLRGRGMRPTFVAMHPYDLEPLAWLKQCAGEESEPTCTFADARSFLDFMSQCRLVIGMRLHSVVLASCVGTPALSVGYGPKCLDFMESMGLERWHVDVSEDEREEISSLALRLADESEALRPEILGRALAYRDGLVRYASEALAAYM